VLDLAGALLAQVRGRAHSFVKWWCAFLSRACTCLSWDRSAIVVHSSSSSSTVVVHAHASAGTSLLVEQGGAVVCSWVEMNWRDANRQLGTAFTKNYMRGLTRCNTAAGRLQCIAMLRNACHVHPAAVHNGNHCRYALTHVGGSCCSCTLQDATWHRAATRVVCETFVH
jgi:hypothetical protein